MEIETKWAAIREKNKKGLIGRGEDFRAVKPFCMIASRYTSFICQTHSTNSIE
jgi:hypothetical protein